MANMLDACKRMHYVNEALELYGEDEASKHLAGAVEEIMNNCDCAYHDPTCACQRLDGWQFASSLDLIKRLKTHYYNIANRTHGGADGPSPYNMNSEDGGATPEVTYFVNSDKYNLFGDYTVRIIDEGYLFTLKAPGSKYVVVPLSEKMGMGAFINVPL